MNACDKIQRIFDHQREMDLVFAPGRTPLIKTLQAADQTLTSDRISFAYAGGLARTFHGKAAYIDNVDILLSTRDIEKAKQSLINAGLIKKSPLEYSNPLRYLHRFSFGDREIKLLVFPQHESFIQELMNRTDNAPGLGKILSLEDLVLLKLVAFRLKDKAHIVEVLDKKHPDLAYIETWCGPFGILDRYAFLFEEHGEA